MWVGHSLRLRSGQALSDAFEHDARCFRVQVKSTLHQSCGGHCCQVGGSQRKAYVDGLFDFAAVYLIPSKRLVHHPYPAERRSDQRLFFAGLQNSKYGQYENAWHLLKSILPLSATSS